MMCARADLQGYQSVLIFMREEGTDFDSSSQARIENAYQQ